MSWPTGPISSSARTRRRTPRPRSPKACPTRPSFALGVAPQGDLGDALLFVASWELSAQDGLTWNVAFPTARAATLRLVELPDDLAAYRPGALAQFGFAQGALVDQIDREGLAGFLQDASSGRVNGAELRLSTGSFSDDDGDERTGRRARPPPVSVRRAATPLRRAAASTARRPTLPR